MEPDSSTQHDPPTPRSVIPRPEDSNKPTKPVPAAPKAETSLSGLDTSLTTPLVYLFAVVVVLAILVFSYVAVKTVSHSLESGDFVKKLDSFLFQNYLEPPATTSSYVVTNNKEKARERNSLGWAKLNASNYAEAEVLFTEAISLDPTFALPYNNVGIVYHRQGNIEGAKKYYKKAIEVDPTYVKPVFNLGQIYKELGEYASAVEQFTRAIEVDSSFAPSYERLGGVYLLQGRVNRGLEAYREAVALGSEESAWMSQILENFAKDPDDIRRSFDIIPPDNMTFLGGSNSDLKEAHIVYHERVSTDSAAVSIDNPDYARTFYVDITNNDFATHQDHGELFGPQEKAGAPGYPHYALPQHATISSEEQRSLIINGQIATYTRYSSPDDSDWYGEAVVIETDQYEYFIHNGGKRDNRFKEFYESFRYELGPKPVETTSLNGVQIVTLDENAEVSVFADQVPTEQVTELQPNEAGCAMPEIEPADLLLEYETLQFQLPSFGIPKQRNGTWQTTNHLVNLGLSDKAYDFVWSPVIRLGEGTFVLPNYNTITATTYTERGRTYCDYNFTYDVFYLVDGILRKDTRNKSPYTVNSLITDLESDREIRPFCFDGCG